jgi:putative ABC transport system permease protein
VAADVKAAGLDQSTPVQVYADYLQELAFPRGSVPAITVLARTAQDPAAIGSGMKSAILDTDRSQPVFAIQPMTEVVSQSIALRRLALALLAFFAASALFLAALGLYGVMSYNVTLRTGEIGIRMALGAQPSQVLSFIERQGLALTLAGVALGFGGAFALTRLMNDLLFRVDSRDPLTFAAVAAVLVLVSLSACYLPARRAARIDPMAALRCQ